VTTRAKMRGPRPDARRRPELLSTASGPAVARLFDALLAFTFLVAWASLAVQARPLFGSRGLMPAGHFVDLLRGRGVGFFDAPTWMLWTGASDRVLATGLAAGVALAVLALAGVAPRLCFAASTLLYLGYVVVARTFLAFQWDNLLLECGALALLLPRDRRAPWAHLLFRVLLFKLYFESGLAKWQSPLHDWQDGSAMSFYYETAPLPTRLAHLAHAMPAFWHVAEAWLTLALELVLPFAIFGPRRARLVAAALFTGFQLVNIATANYGFFAYLAIALHVFLLDDADVVRAQRAALRRLPRLRRARVVAALFARRCRRRAAQAFAFARRPIDGAPSRLARRLAIGAIAIGYVVVSAAAGLVQFADAADLAWIAEPLVPFRVVNNYHLFASITRERIEPAFQTFDGLTWTTHSFGTRRAIRLARPTSSRRTSRASTSSSGSTGSRSAAGCPSTSRVSSTSSAAIRPRRSRSFATRCRPRPTRCGSRSIATPSRRAKSSPRPAGGGASSPLARASRTAARGDVY
jgi:hypothetical protein